MGECSSSSAIWVGYDHHLLKVLVLGDSGVGKTSFLCRFIDNVFCDRFVSTVGIDFREKSITYHDDQCHGTKRVLLQLWDTAGQERYRSLTTSFYRDVHGYILIFDLTNETSFLQVYSWMMQLEPFLDFDRTGEMPVVLCGNKNDQSVNRIVTFDEALSLANHYEIPYFETSAANGEGIDDSINRLLHIMIHNSPPEAGLNREMDDRRRRTLMSLSGDEEQMKQDLDRLRSGKRRQCCYLI